MFPFGCQQVERGQRWILLNLSPVDFGSVLHLLFLAALSMSVSQHSCCSELSPHSMSREGKGAGAGSGTPGVAEGAQGAQAWRRGGSGATLSLWRC